MKVNFRYDTGLNTRNNQRIAELVNTILELNYGSTISFYKCAEILHYNIDDEKEKRKFQNSMSRVRNFLIDYGYVLKSVAGIGYYILKPKQISGYCYHTYIRKTENLLDKSSRILTHVATSELSDIRKEEHQNVIDLNLDVTNAIDSTIEASEYYNKKNYYDNLED